MKYIIAVIILIGEASFISCNKLDVTEDIPKCVSKIIKRDKDKNCLYSVYAYDFKGVVVYGFSYPCPEGCFILLDSDCNTLIDSNGIPYCTCDWGGSRCNADFSKNYTNERIIWKKEL